MQHGGRNTESMSSLDCLAIPSGEELAIPSVSSGHDNFFETFGVWSPNVSNPKQHKNVFWSNQPME